MRRVLLLSGPNLNLLGEREPEIYGTDTLDDHVARATRQAEAHGLGLDHFQSNSEGDLVTAIQKGRGTHDAVIINAAALTHYAWSIHDALAAFDGPIVELHISDLKKREEWRHFSVIEPVADACIAGHGGKGYEMAVDAVAEMLSGRDA